jgi:energy-converting hydrogenase Eha subunit H
MSFRQFIDGIRFNFVNVFAYSIFLAYLGISMLIIVDKDAASNQHITDIRNQWGNLTLIVATFYFGASMLAKKKDETLDKMVDSSNKKDEAIKTLTDDAKNNS